MTVLGWSFAAPALLWGLAALPLLWVILRAVPPAPQQKRFPAVLLLLGLNDRAKVAARTPWWLLMLRMLAIAAAIVGFSGPTRAPIGGPAPSNAPLLILMDGGWAEAHDWPALRAAALQGLAQAGREGRRVALLRLTDTPAPPEWQAADTLRSALAAAQPTPLPPARLTDWAAALGDTPFDTLWLSDGLDHPGRATLLAKLQARGALEVVLPARPLYALAPATFEGGDIVLTALRLPSAAPASITLLAIGRDPAGQEATLARLPANFAAGTNRATARLTLPPELRARITRFAIDGQRSAGAVSLTDDTVLRRKVAIISGAADAEGLQLLSPTHYLTTALAPSSDLLRGSIAQVLPSKPNAIVLADVAKIGAQETEALAKWINDGGTLLRFAGPRLANATFDLGTENLLPVRLRAGGRQAGGAMSWGEAKSLAPFAPTSPFAGLTIGADVTVTAQVLAEPDPNLAEATLAALADGTPLVTRRKMGAGQIVLFHVTANAEWSSLPLSGLFVQMLERLAVASRSAAADQAEVAGSIWQAERLTGPFGTPEDGTALAGVAGDAMWQALQTGPSSAVPAGLYAGQTRKVAVNIIGADQRLTAFAWPADVRLRGVDQGQVAQAKGPLLTAAFVLLALDIIASLALGGRLAGRAAARGGKVLGALALLAFAAPPAPAQAQTQPAPAPAQAQTQPAPAPAQAQTQPAPAPAQAQTQPAPAPAQAQTQPAPAPAQAQTQPNTNTAPSPQGSDVAALRATSGVVLAHVLTGDRALDDMAQAGLRGLGDVLTYRTSIEPNPPVGVDIETDQLDFYPFLYWPISARQDLPSANAVAKLNQFLRTGGMIMFDTRAGDLAGGPEEQMLQTLTLGLDIPPLEPIPQDHVLTRSFYLIDAFPGRYEGGPVWVEAAPQADDLAPEGMPFRNQNDGVTPVIIGGNDWAGAWAVDEFGSYLNPVGRGFAGEEQREYAYRFGVNVIMHVLTGNYKSDQVHVPALLDRLSQ